ncbi:MAG: serine/threonine-protein kinase [Pseudomonadota bacterium]
MTHPLPGDIFNVGQVLNNTYEIDRILGRGGTGEVYRARNKITDRLVAIKALNRQFSGNADYIELMKREEEMRAIQHEAVVRYTECSLSDDGHVFLVMDYVEGPPLSEVMTRRRMDPRELLIIGHRVAEGLVATHAKGIIHRDLSPDNIILRQGDPSKATIIDFGIAKDTAVGARTIVGSEFAGKYEYSAPEQLEGQVSPQSDLYALGATLLAAWQGETPFSGATPGEIIRRKQAPLDTDGVPDLLRGIIDGLTAPDPLNRPEDATALVTQIDAVLRPNRDAAPGAKKASGGRRPWVIGGGGTALAALGLAWFGGAFDPFLTPPLPVADPYVLDLVIADGTPPVLTGNAPDADTANTLRISVTNSLGQTPTGEIVLAAGLPDSNWTGEAQALLQHVSALETAQLSISDRNATLAGRAADAATRSSVTAVIDSFAADHGWQIIRDLQAGPLSISAQAIADAIRNVEDCGPLTIEGANQGQFGLRDPIRITGNIAENDTRAAIAGRLDPMVGDRPITVATQTLNSELCTIRRTLGAVPTNIVTLALSNGETGQRNLSGVFTVGQNPVVDVLIPQQHGNDALWVLIVEPDGSVFNVIPNRMDARTQIGQLSEPQDGFHRIRALHTIEEFLADNGDLAFRITDGNFGKSEIIAILSRAPLFDGRRPTSESVAATAQALDELLATDADNIIGFAAAIIDARP